MTLIIITKLLLILLQFLQPLGYVGHIFLFLIFFVFFLLEDNFSESLVLLFPLTDFGCGYQKYLVILLTFLPGTTISKVPSTPQLLYEVGRTAARMDKTLQNV